MALSKWVSWGIFAAATATVGVLWHGPRVRDTGANKATATVSFKSLGDRRTVVLALVKLKVGWRIADITWDRNGTLRGLLSK